MQPQYSYQRHVCRVWQRLAPWEVCHIETTLLIVCHSMF